MAEWTILDEEANVPALHFLAAGCCTSGELRAKIQVCFLKPTKNAQLNIVTNRLTSHEHVVYKGLVAYEVQNLNGEWEDFSKIRLLKKGPKRPDRLRITTRGRLVLDALRQSADPTNEMWFCEARIPDDSKIEEIVKRGPLLKKVPLQANTTESFAMGQRDEVEAFRDEQKLVQEFEQYIQQEHTFTAKSLRISLPDGAAPIIADFWVEDIRLLLEAKSSTDRNSFRLAIGQLADYGRFCSPSRRGILLPEKPSADLLDLAETQQLEVHWKTAEGFDGTCRIA